MTQIKRLIVSFVDKDTMTKVANTSHVLVRSLPDGELVATLYEENSHKEVEIKVEYDGSVE